MKTWRLEFSPIFLDSPMTYWVHGDGAKPRTGLPRPDPNPGCGYAMYVVEFNGVHLQFASTDELAECIRVLGKRNLPTTISLTQHTSTGPNGHWLSRLPAKFKTWRIREQLVAYLEEILVSSGDQNSSSSANQVSKNDIET